jgi:23S rRNA (uracil-5-)-methyltransferase RumA
MKNLERGAFIELTIQDYAYGGKGIARIETDDGTYPIFVEHAFPGQTVLAKITAKRKKHAEANLIEVLARASNEQNYNFQQISGAPYIFIPIEEQQKVKQSTTIDIFRKIGGIRNATELFHEYILSPMIFNYRNKMEYAFSCIEHDIENNREIDCSFALGFKRRGTWWKVENLNKESGLFDCEWENKLHQFRNYLKSTGLPAWHPPQKKGFFRHLVVRKSFHQNQLLVNLVTSSEGLKNFDVVAAGNFLKSLYGSRIAGFQHTVNDNIADRAKIENGTWHLIFGEEKVVEKLLGLEFEISMESFFQTNPKCAELLYSKAMDYVFLNNDLNGKVIMDLFCGTGTIAQIISTRTSNAQIIGVDIVPEAIADAEKNAQRNSIKNVDFFTADVGKFLKEYPQYIGKIETIVLDPPRAGIAPKTLQKVIDLKAKRIVYISCNPSTQARDAKTLIEQGYRMEKFSLVDQFPHTGHIETVALFEKN